MIEFCNVMITICSATGVLLGVLMSYKALLVVLGLFKKQKFKETENLHNYGICIAARNEEKVIANLLDSIYNQDYPKEKLKIFICVNNSTDNTAKIIREYKTRNNCENLYLFEYENNNERTKGYALRYLFNQIKTNYGINCVEGFFVFDADNVLMSNYITKMNEAYDSGEKIITSCRLSKNMNQNWISFQYGIHWLTTCLVENRAKYLFNLACRVQGTGFLFDKSLVENWGGWIYTSLTEDRAFCSDAVIKGYKISYCEDAKFYDEQPYKLKVALRQRLRWAKGHLQSSVENCPKLTKNMFVFNKTFFMSYDMFWINFPNHIEGGVRKVLSYIFKFCLVFLLGVQFSIVFGYDIGWFILSLVITYIGTWLLKCVQPIYTLIVFRKQIEKMNFFKMVGCILLFPIFHIIGKWCSYIAMFKRVEWKPIEHDSVMQIEKLNQTK